MSIFGETNEHAFNRCVLLMGTYMEIYGLIFFEVGTGIGLYELMSLLFSEKFIDFSKN